MNYEWSLLRGNIYSYIHEIFWMISYMDSVAWSYYMEAYVDDLISMETYVDGSLHGAYVDFITWSLCIEIIIAWSLCWWYQYNIMISLHGAYVMISLHGAPCNEISTWILCIDDLNMELHVIRSSTWSLCIDDHHYMELDVMMIIITWAYVDDHHYMELM